MMIDTMGEYGTFWFYMVWTLAGLFFVYFFLPETKGRSLEDIEMMFSAKGKMDKLSSRSGSVVSNRNGVVTLGIDEKSAEASSPDHISDKTFHSNDGYQYDSDDEDNDEVVVTPL